MASAARLGLPASTVAVEGAAPGEPESGDLLPEQAGRAGARLPRRLARAAAILLVLLGAVALYRPIHAARLAAEELRAEVATAKRAADRASHAKQAIAQLSEGERYLVDRKRARPSVTEILCELTRVLPDDTWLTRVNIDVDAVRLEGYSDASSALIERLGQSALLNEPKFPAAVIQDSATGKERFQLAAKVARKGGS
jgi:general secretion pathway protein L